MLADTFGAARSKKEESVDHAGEGVRAAFRHQKLKDATTP